MTGQEPEKVPGRCYTCKGWTAAGRPVAEDVGNSGGGGVTVVVCAACEASPGPRPRLSIEPRRHQ